LNDPIQPRIVNGRNVNDASERYPYFITLRDAYDYHVCGGTLIASDIILSAAHCQYVPIVDCFSLLRPNQRIEHVALTRILFFHCTNKTVGQ
jgi:hypothetical protein